MSTICAISTPHGIGGIAVIRVSGDEAISIANRIWKGKNLEQTPSHTAHLGVLVDPDNGERLDEAVATVFRAPASFTGEDVVELSVHGSQWIQNELVNMLIRNGCQLAEPGEFTRRAFANGKLDLTEAEAVADVIAATSRASNRLAQQQMRGQFSAQLGTLHDSMLELASLLELELDFSEEDVEFADRRKLLDIAETTLRTVDSLAASFATGDAIRRGVPTAIVGAPNAGKSSVLNQLIGDDRAIVSDIPGTTRDTIEDTADLGGITFRFIDTAGLRRTSDAIENLGIERSIAAIRRARIVLWVIDARWAAEKPEELGTIAATIVRELPDDARAVAVLNKTDLIGNEEQLQSLIDSTLTAIAPISTLVAISAATQPGVPALRTLLPSLFSPTPSINVRPKDGQTAPASNGGVFTQALLNDDQTVIVTNARHYQALLAASASLQRVIGGLRANLSGDLVAQDVRETLHHLSSITGVITTPDILATIFSRFCVGK